MSGISYTFSTVDVPGATSITVSGLNNSGEVVGSYVDSAGTSHGFTDVGGSITTIDLPGALGGTLVTGVNDSGELVGTDRSYIHGFSYQGGVFADAGGDIALAVNNAGTIIGEDYAFAHGATVGFVNAGGTVTQLGSFDASAGSPNLSTIIAVNNQGDAIGTGDGFSNFKFDAQTGQISALDVPGPMTALNDSGVIAGRIIEANGQQQGYIDQNGTVTIVDVPGAQSTAIVSINDLGVALGAYTDASGHTFAFVYQNGQTTPLDIPGAVDTKPVAINNANEIVGTYTDAQGITHGFIGLDPPAPAVADAGGSWHRASAGRWFDFAASAGAHDGAVPGAWHDPGAHWQSAASA